MKKRTTYHLDNDGYYWYVNKFNKWFFVDDIPKGYSYSSCARFSTKKQLEKSIYQLRKICTDKLYISKICSTRSGRFITKYKLYHRRSNNTK